MYAGVPCYHLKALAKEIESDMPTPRSLYGAWREMRATWHRQKTQPDYTFDTPVPVTEDSSRMSVDDAIVTSIGDLAPKGSKIT